MNRDTAALVMNHLSVFDLAAWSATCHTMRNYLHHFLRMRVQPYVPFRVTPQGLLCIWAEIRGDVGESAYFIGEQFGFTTTSLARMVKRYGRNFTTPPKANSLGFYGGFDRYPLSVIAEPGKYNPNIHSANLQTVLKRRAKERSYRAKARSLRRKPLHDTILALINVAPQNQCWRVVLQRLTQEKKRPTNSQIRKVEQYGAQCIVTAFMQSRFMTRRQHFFAEYDGDDASGIDIVRAEIVMPWVESMVKHWIDADPDDYVPRTIFDLMNAVTAPRISDLQAWVDEATDYLQGIINRGQSWPLVHRLLASIKSIDMAKIAREYHHFPPLNGRTLTRFACTSFRLKSDTDLVNVYMQSQPDEPRMRGVNWNRLGSVMQKLWDRTAMLIEYTQKDVEMTAEVIRRNPSLTLFVARVDIQQFPHRYLDEDALSFLLFPFIRADQDAFHPWVAIKLMRLIALQIQKEESIKMAETLLLRQQSLNDGDDRDNHKSVPGKRPMMMSPPSERQPAKNKKSRRIARSEE